MDPSSKKDVNVKTYEEINPELDSKFSDILINYISGSDDPRINEAYNYWKRRTDWLQSTEAGLYMSIEQKKETIYKIWETVDSLTDKILKILRVDSTVKRTYKLLSQGKDYPKALKCGRVKKVGDLIYSCETCRKNWNIEGFFCFYCFNASNHKGHKFITQIHSNLTTCQCGDKDFLQPTGFCSNHGEEPNYDRLDGSLASFICYKLIVWSFLRWRGWNIRYNEKSGVRPHVAGIILPSYCHSDFCSDDVYRVGEALDILHKCLSIGGPIKKNISEILLNEELYRKLTEENFVEFKEGNRIVMNLDWRSRTLFQDDRNSFNGNAQSKMFMKCDCLLDEFIFWLIRQDFAEEISNFLLELLSEDGIKERMGKRLIEWFPIISAAMKFSSENQTKLAMEMKVNERTGYRIRNLFEQVLGSEKISLELNKNGVLLESIISVHLNLLRKMQMMSLMSLDPSNTYRNQLLMQSIQKSDWPVIRFEDDSKTTVNTNGTLLNVLGIGPNGFMTAALLNSLVHEPIIMALADDDRNLKEFMKIPGFYQGCYQIWRLMEDQEHKLLDTTEEIRLSFAHDFSILTKIKWYFINCILKYNRADLAVKFFNRSLMAVKEWLSSMVGEGNLRSVISCPMFTVSFHLPLHRYLSSALISFRDMEEAKTHMDTIREDKTLLRTLMLNPVRIQVARAERRANMWLRNSCDMVQSEMYYADKTLSHTLLLPDIDLIRYCSANLDPEWVMECLIHNFHISESYIMDDYIYGLKIPDPVTNREQFIQDKNDENLMKFIDESPELVLEAMKLYPELFILVKERNTEFEEKMEEIAKNHRLARIVRGFLLREIQVLHLNRLKQKPSEEPYMKQRILAAYGLPIDSCLWTPIPLPFERGVILDEKWFPFMMEEFLQLLGELIVVRTNNGATHEETLEMDIAHTVAKTTETYSYIKRSSFYRQVIISARSEELFEKKLAMITEKVQSELKSFKKHPCVYTKKPIVMEKYFCPIYFRMLNTAANSALFLEEIQVEDQITPSPGLKTVKRFMWAPYRLVDIYTMPRFEEIRNIYKLLYTKKFCQFVLYTLLTEGPDDQKVQLVIYFLTLALKASTPEDEKILLNRQLNRPYYFTPHDKYHSVISVLMDKMQEIFNDVDDPKDYLRMILDGECDKEKILGGASEYYARLSTNLCKCDPVFREKLDIITAAATATADEKLAAAQAALEKKKRAKELQERIQLRSQLSAQRILDTFETEVSESGSSSHSDEPDVSGQDMRRRYDCSVCKQDNKLNSLENPFGILITIGMSVITDEQVPYDEPELTLNEARARYVKPITRGTFSVGWASLADRYGFVKEKMNPKTSLDLSSCGHPLHIECYEQYLEMKRNDDPSFQGVAECPTCRAACNAIIPVLPDFRGQQTVSLETRNPEKLFYPIAECVSTSRKIFCFDEDNDSFNKLFGADKTSLTSKILRSVQRMHYPNEAPILDKSITNSSLISCILVSNIERSLILKKLGVVDEEKKKTRAHLTEHLLGMIAGGSLPSDEQKTKTALQELYLQTTRNIKLPTPTMEMGVTCSDPETTSANRGFSSHELEALTTTSPRHKMRRFSDGDTGLEEDDNYKPTSLFDHDLKRLLVNVISYIWCHASYTKEDKKILVLAVTERITASWIVRATLSLLMRSEASMHNLRDYGKLVVEDGLEDVATNVRLGLAQAEMVFQSFVEKLSEKRQEAYNEDKVRIEFRLKMEELLNFVFVLYRNLGLIPMTSTVNFDETNLKKAMEIIGLSWINCIPTREMTTTWISDYQMTLSWAVLETNPPLVFEPLVWRPRRLLHPPTTYSETLKTYFMEKCQKCGKCPVESLLCLVCGDIVCLSHCCRDTTANKEEFESHAISCASACAVYLSLNTTIVIMTKANLVVFCDTIYLDNHGERDYKITRGEELYFSPELFSIVEKIWMEQDMTKTTRWQVANLSVVLSYLYDMASRQSPPESDND